MGRKNGSSSGSRNYYRGANTSAVRRAKGLMASDTDRNRGATQASPEVRQLVHNGFSVLRHCVEALQIEVPEQGSQTLRTPKFNLLTNAHVAKYIGNYGLLHVTDAARDLIRTYRSPLRFTIGAVETRVISRRNVVLLHPDQETTLAITEQLEKTTELLGATQTPAIQPVFAGNHFTMQPAEDASALYEQYAVGQTIIFGPTMTDPMLPPIQLQD